jgi:hypothetical protein
LYLLSVNTRDVIAHVKTGGGLEVAATLHISLFVSSDVLRALFRGKTYEYITVRQCRYTPNTVQQK